MTSATDPSTALTPFPDHTQLPESDRTFVFAERSVPEAKTGKSIPKASYSLTRLHLSSNNYILKVNIV